MFRSLAIRNYRLWFIGALVSNIGAWMQSTTQNWVVLVDLTDNDAVAVGITMALQFGPQFVLVPITGYLADRFNRRTILFFTQSTLMLLAVSLGLLLILGHAELWHLYLFALLLGIVNAIDNPARQTFVSDLVAEHNMSNAVALNSASFNMARMIGPAISGVLIVAIGSGWVFIANAVAFIGMLTALALLRTSELRRQARASKRGGQLIEGFTYVRTRPDLIIVFIIVFLMGALGTNFPIMASTMAVEFGKGAGEYGLLSSILAIGSLTGALLAARRERARMRVVIISAGLFGVAAVVASLMPTYWSFAAALIFIGFTTVTLLTTANGFVQTTTDPAVRGRVMALYMAILLGGTPIGAPILGWIANEFGARWTIGVAAAAGFVACGIGITWWFVARSLRLHFHPDTRWRLVVTHIGRPMPGTSPAEFSEAVALTAPIPLPSLKKAHRPAEARDPRPVDDGQASAPAADAGAPDARAAASPAADAGASEAGRTDTKPLPVVPPRPERSTRDATPGEPISRLRRVIREPETLTGPIQR